MIMSVKPPATTVQIIFFSRRPCNLVPVVYDVFIGSHCDRRHAGYKLQGYRPHPWHTDVRVLHPQTIDIIIYCTTTVQPHYCLEFLLLCCHP